MSRFLVLALALLLGASAHAGPLDKLSGRYGFNWNSDPAKAKCVKVEGKLLGEFKGAAYSCDLHEVTNTSSGESAVVCTKKDKSKEYLIFKTRAQCETERETQASNE